ncbi:MAG: helix-turn-helix transcriptional regulator [Bacteroidota bacterium]
MQHIEIPVFDFILAMLSWGVILFGMAIGTALFFKREGRKVTNRLLATALVIAASCLISKLVVLVGLAEQFWALYVLPFNLTLSIPLLLYFYFKFKLNPGLSFKKQDIWHFVIPSIQALIYGVIGCSSVAFKTEIWRNGFLIQLYSVEDILLPLFIGCYGYASFRLLKISATDWGLAVRIWLQNLLRVLVVLLSIHLLFMLIWRLKIGEHESMIYLNYLSLLSLLFFTTIKALEQYFPQRIYAGSTFHHSIPRGVDHSSANEAWFREQTQRLFERENIFLNPDLNVAILCKAYGITERQLSEYTQKAFDKNVNELINHYRIQHVLSCLQEGQHTQYNILSIGYSAGFPSKSTFYRVFKKMTNCTPSEYIKSLQDQ